MLAEELGTSVPRVTRAVERMGIDARKPSGQLALTRTQARRLAAELGVRRRAPGLSLTETLVLAALRSAPFGLVSARASARRSGVSPTATARALTALSEAGLAICREERMAAGRAVTATIWRANVTHPRWAELDPVLDDVVPPQRQTPTDQRVPDRLRHLFWNTADSQLVVSRGGPYIARRLLQTLDIQGLAWGAKTLRAEDWQQAAKARGLAPDVRALASNLAAEAAR